MAKNPYFSLDKAILGEVYSSSEPMDNIIKMCDEFGSRFPGTPGDKLAVDFMVGRFEEYGLENVHAEEYTLPGWIRGPSALEILSPTKRKIDSIALPHTPDTEATGKLVNLGDGPVDIYEKRKDEIEGNIVMVTSKNPAGMIRPLHRTEKLYRSILAGAAGFIFVNQYPAYGPQTGGVATVIPSVGIDYEDGCYLARTVQRNGEVKIKVSTPCKNKDLQSWNVVADLPGTSRSKEYIAVGAHYEGHDISVGAVDSGSGACTVMEIARVLAKAKKNIKRRIRFICFSAEEIGLYGSIEYVRRHKDELKDLRFMLNLDASGGEGEKGFAIHGWDELEPFFKKVAEETNAVMPIYQQVSPYSDHWGFFVNGVPTASMGDPEAMQRRGGRGYGHSKYDTVDKINIKDYWAAASNGARLLLRISNTEKWPVKHRSYEEVDKIIEKQGYKETVALTKKMLDYLSTKKGLKPDVLAYVTRLKKDLETKESIGL